MKPVLMAVTERLEINTENLDFLKQGKAQNINIPVPEMHLQDTKKILIART